MYIGTSACRLDSGMLLLHYFPCLLISCCSLSLFIFTHLCQDTLTSFLRVSPSCLKKHGISWQDAHTLCESYSSHTPSSPLIRSGTLRKFKSSVKQITPTWTTSVRHILTHTSHNARGCAGVGRRRSAQSKSHFYSLVRSHSQLSLGP